MSAFSKVKVSVLEVGLWLGFIFLMFNFSSILIELDPLLESMAKSHSSSSKLLSLIAIVVGIGLFIARCKFVLNPFKGHLLRKLTQTSPTEE
jgi:hypothetical protein